PAPRAGRPGDVFCRVRGGSARALPVVGNFVACAWRPWPCGRMAGARRRRAVRQAGDRSRDSTTLYRHRKNHGVRFSGPIPSSPWRGDRLDDVEAAYRRYFVLIREKCRRMLADFAEADDVAQETFVRLWRADLAGGNPRSVL